jgi:hypothetical protein
MFLDEVIEMLYHPKAMDSATQLTIFDIIEETKKEKDYDKN